MMLQSSMSSHDSCDVVSCRSAGEGLWTNRLYEARGWRPVPSFEPHWQRIDISLGPRASRNFCGHAWLEVQPSKILVCKLYVRMYPCAHHSCDKAIHQCRFASFIMIHTHHWQATALTLVCTVLVLAAILHVKRSSCQGQHRH